MRYVGGPQVLKRRWKTTDGHAQYATAIERVFGIDVRLCAVVAPPESFGGSAPHAGPAGLVPGRGLVCAGSMQSSARAISLLPVAILLPAVLLTACGVAESPIAQLASSPPTPAAPAKIAPSPSVTVSHRVAALSPNAAETACRALLDDIPDTVTKSGKATVAAAYEVRGDQLATYLETFGNGYPSQWRDEPAKLIGMCIFDGDFDTMTPGPPGHDTSAVRVLVLIPDGAAMLWAIARDKSALPTTDPATLAQ